MRIFNSKYYIAVALVLIIAIIVGGIFAYRYYKLSTTAVLELQIPTNQGQQLKKITALDLQEYNVEAQSGYIAANEKFLIFVSKNQTVELTINGPNFKDNRLAAENVLLDFFKELDKSTICKMNTIVILTVLDGGLPTGDNVGLSFCPNSKQL